MAQRMDGLRMAQGLGWFSLAVGIADTAAPTTMARLMGIPESGRSRDLLRAVGLREIASGIGILAADRPAPWLWARVGGDAMDLALLGAALGNDQVDRRRIGGAMALVAGIAALDLYCVRQVADRAGQAIEVHQTITINRRPEAVYAFWRDLRNLPRFLSHLEDVQVANEQRSHWRAKAPAGTTVEWDAEITADVRNQSLAWRSLEGADIPNSGEVRFEPAPAGRGTVVRVTLHYQPPGGRVGMALAKLFGREPGQEIRADLRQLKQVLETGEVTRSEASIHPGPHPARPTRQPVIPQHFGA